jgi:hypothetical protein
MLREAVGAAVLASDVVLDIVADLEIAGTPVLAPLCADAAAAAFMAAICVS